MTWPALGLRPRLVAALVLVGAVALGVAAVAVLSPLERRLRHDQSVSLEVAAQSARENFRVLMAQPRATTPGRLARRLSSLARSTQAVATLMDAHDVLASSDDEEPGAESDALPALTAGKTTHDTRGGDLYVAVPFAAGGTHFALVLRKRLTDVAAASRVVKRAFVTAGLVGLAAAVILGLGLATALLRRLGRLRDAARDMTERGARAQPPGDTGRDEIGELSRAFAAMQDGLRRQEAARRTFVATASHELRTPLASLQGTLELLGDDLRDDDPDLDDAREQVASAHEQAKRLTALSVDLLDLTRLDADLPLRVEPVELGEVAQAVAAEFAVRGHEQGIELRIVRPGPLWAQGDPGAIARVLRILIDNAMRFAPRDTAVEVAVSASDGLARASVSDDGPGVADDERQIVFERFRRGRTPGGGGFGLGLAIGRELAQRMEGTLELVTGDAGEGARFELRLPAAVGDGVSG
jgi:signal transduction histidine kinase